MKSIRINSDMIIHIIGDSHALTFGGIPNIKVHWLGPATAFRLYTKHIDIKKVMKHIPINEDIWFIFGEIDCRIHIYAKSLEIGLNMDFLAQTTASQYVQYINYLDKIVVPNKISIMTIVPQGYADNSWDIEYFAERDTRQAITKCYNRWLEHFCKEFNVPLISLWPEDLPLECYDYDSPGRSPKGHLRNEVVYKYVAQYLGRINGN